MHLRGVRIVYVCLACLGWSATLLFESFFIRLARIASRHFLVPRRMERPRPRFTDCPACHSAKRSGLANRAQINVDEDSAEHDYGGDVVQNIADGHRGSAETARPPTE